MTTEFIQPARPMRIYTDSKRCVLCAHVFAVAISNSNDLEYLTIDGNFYTKANVMYAETLLNGVWHAIDSRIKPEL